VTEAEWLACTDLAPMVDFLRATAKGNRKFVLFEAGCCRRFWEQMTDPRSRRAVEVAERYADGRTTNKEVADAARGAEEAAFGTVDWRGTPEGIMAKACAWQALKNTGETPFVTSWGLPGDCEILRDLFGNPFRPVALAPTWLAWNGGALVKLAQAIYDERRFGDLPVLADALEEAGCMDADILGHCRSGGEHVRGCWVVDLVLGET
jgi:hypothetical protein